jgi:chromosome segregation ATPase
MRPACIVVLACCLLADASLAQEPADKNQPAPPTPSESSSVAPASSNPTVSNVPAPPGSSTSTSPGGQAPAQDTLGAREVPVEAEPFDARVHRRLEEYEQRHQGRQREMATYQKVSGDPELQRFADPRRVQVELSDELDRERTSEELAGDYSEQAHTVQSKIQALREFVAKRRQTADDLGKQNGTVNRQDLEVALQNLARQPESSETLAKMREIDRKLSDAERNEKNLPLQIAQSKQEGEYAAGELGKLQALEQSYEKESKAFTADAASAHQNRLRLADRLEYFVVVAQAEDELSQGQKAIASVQHLSASPEVEATLTLSGAAGKSDEAVQRLRDCVRQTDDVKGCREKLHQE